MLMNIVACTGEEKWKKRASSTVNEGCKKKKAKRKDKGMSVYVCWLEYATHTTVINQAFGIVLSVSGGRVNIN